jgi:hypothetical protein
MRNSDNKILAIAVSILMIISIVISMVPLQNMKAQAVTNIPTYAYINVAPNPCGVGQQVTVNFWLAVPNVDSSLVKNMTIVVTHPDKTTETLGPFTSDLTGGTFTLYTPNAAGNYTFQFIYPGQTVQSGRGYEQPSQSEVLTLVVQQQPATGIPYTPLPSSWWQTPVNAENVQNWASITGSWMGYAANTFANTGGYNATGNYNPYTTAPASAHIIWTKPWCIGGVAGGELGNSEQFSSYWTTSQYNPKYAPIIMNGIEYSSWFTTTTSSQQGIMAIDLFTGKTLWVINTNYTLRCGMIVSFENINQYGCVGPYIFATSGGGFFGGGTSNWYMFDGMTGQYLCEIDTAPSFAFLGQDPNGNIIGYAWNSTTGSMRVGSVTYTINDTRTYGPALEMFNLTKAMGQTGLNWGISLGTKYQWINGLQWLVQPLPPVVNGITTTGLGTGAFGYSAWSGNTLVMTTGATSVEETYGWLVEAGFNSQTGALMWIQNRTGPAFVPYTRTSNTPSAAAGVYVEINQATYDMQAFSLTTGQEAWRGTLNVTMADGNWPNDYDAFDFETVPDSTTGVLYVWALGGDVWAVNMTNGNIIWTFSTLQANGPAGTETPYGIYPIWVFSDEALAGNPNPILYLSEGHEYSPPLFHGALVLALNGTTGKLIWSNLAFDDTATAVAYGVMTTFNAYDGQIYAYAKGPSKTTVNAPNIGVTTATPITITGTVMDVCAGASQSAVAANFPNGLPCVSDASMTGWMEFVYEQQPCPSTVTGVPVSVWVLDSNNNYRQIGSTTTDGSGTYSLTWTPDIPGNFTVVAMFAGSEAYYSSNAETHFYASAAAPTPTPPQYPVPFDYTWTIIGMGIAIIIVVIIVGILLLLRKK